MSGFPDSIFQSYDKMLLEREVFVYALNNPKL